MPGNPKTWLYALAAWLALANIGHTALGVPALLAEAANPAASRYAAFQAMLADPRSGYFNVNMFDLFFLGMLNISLFLLFAAVVTLWVARTGDAATVRQFCRLNAAFWAAALAACLLFYPVDNMVVIAGGAVVFGLAAFWRAETARA